MTEYRIIHTFSVQYTVMQDVEASDLDAAEVMAEDGYWEAYDALESNMAERVWDGVFEVGPTGEIEDVSSANVYELNEATPTTTATVENQPTAA